MHALNINFVRSTLKRPVYNAKNFPSKVHTGSTILTMANTPTIAGTCSRPSIRHIHSNAIRYRGSVL